jgi:hypothetical protein
MELGFLAYFVVVFVLGGTLLIGSAVFLGWELVNWRRRPACAKRTPLSRARTVSTTTLFICLLSVPLRMIWVTRVDAIPGSYKADGVWGTATLSIRADGTFVEIWKFKNAYNEKSEGEGQIRGTWRTKGRDWFTRDLYLEPFKGLAEYDRDRSPGTSWAYVMGYSGFTAIEVDVGADIVFWK